MPPSGEFSFADGKTAPPGGEFSLADEKIAPPGGEISLAGEKISLPGEKISLPGGEVSPGGEVDTLYSKSLFFLQNPQKHRFSKIQTPEAVRASGVYILSEIYLTANRKPAQRSAGSYSINQSCQINTFGKVGN